MRFSDLVGRRVVTESGEPLGRIHDVRGEIVDGRLRVTGLIAGELGRLERYGLRSRGRWGASQPKMHDHPLIAWERVVSVGRQIVVRDEGAGESARGR